MRVRCAAGQRGALEEGEGVVALGKGAGLGDGLGAVGLEVGWQLAVEVRGGGVAGQIAERSLEIAAEVFEIDHAGNADEAVDVKAVLGLQIFAQAGAANAAVAFTAKIFRRSPALLAGG